MRAGSKSRRAVVRVDAGQIVCFPICRLRVSTLPQPSLTDMCSAQAEGAWRAEAERNEEMANPANFWTLRCCSFADWAKLLPWSLALPSASFAAVSADVSMRASTFFSGPRLAMPL